LIPNSEERAEQKKNVGKTIYVYRCM